LERSFSIFELKQSQRSTADVSLHGMHNPERVRAMLLRIVGKYLPVDTGNTSQSTAVKT